jgi:hypothetical protein
MNVLDFVVIALHVSTFQFPTFLILDHHLIDHFERQSSRLPETTAWIWTDFLHNALQFG